MRARKMPTSGGVSDDKTDNRAMGQESARQREDWPGGPNGEEALNTSRSNWMFAKWSRGPEDKIAGIRREVRGDRRQVARSRTDQFAGIAGSSDRGSPAPSIAGIDGKLAGLDGKLGRLTEAGGSTRSLAALDARGRGVSARGVRGRSTRSSREIDAKFAGIDAKFAGIDEKFAGVDAKFAGSSSSSSGSTRSSLRWQRAAEEDRRAPRQAGRRPRAPHAEHPADDRGSTPGRAPVVLEAVCARRSGPEAAPRRTCAAGTPAHAALTRRKGEVAAGQSLRHSEGDDPARRATPPASVIS